MNKKTSTILALLAAACMVGYAEVSLNARGEVLSDASQWFWGVLFFVLTVLWSKFDAEERKLEKPFDFDFLMYVFWPIAFPYYLTKSRGSEGVVLFVGFLAVWLGPWLAGFVAWAYLYE